MEDEDEVVAEEEEDTEDQENLEVEVEQEEKEKLDQEVEEDEADSVEEEEEREDEEELKEDVEEDEGPPPLRRAKPTTATRGTKKITSEKETGRRALHHRGDSNYIRFHLGVSILIQFTRLHSASFGNSTDDRLISMSDGLSGG